MKTRYIAITDIYRNEKKSWAEVDDIQSLIRLLLYSNEIEIEGLIASTSCFYKKGAQQKDLAVILDIIHAYEQVKSNLDIHASGYPDAKYLRGISCVGIPEFGKKPGKGFASEKYNDNPGVNRIIEAVDKEDDRPLWIGLWGGANTLAQAIWKVWKSRTTDEFNRFLSKLRIYGISDQDASSGWLREQFGDRLFYIVSPSKGSFWGTKNYALATWPGIAGDHCKHGSCDGKTSGGFQGAREDLISKEWLQENIVSHGVYGAKYPLPVFIMEGDTPAYLGLIPNGLNEPERPDYGGWGGRYRFYKPDKQQFKLKEKYPIWTNATDTVQGINNNQYTSPQATIWRWREAFQNDFAARMDWTISNSYDNANHYPAIKLNHDLALTVHAGDYVDLDAKESRDPDGDILYFNWLYYKEAGDCTEEIEIEYNHTATARFQAPQIPNERKSLTLHVILEVKDNGSPSLTRYQRIIVTVIP
jgi:Protein of unknown function (DUF1593).